MNKFRGLGVAMVTPFDSKHNVDYPALVKLAKHLVNGGVDYLVVMGTTGESVTIDEDEKDQIIATVIETNAGKLPVVLGVGGNNTRGVCKKLASLNTKGIDGILSVSPYYNKPIQAGIVEHYKAVADSTDLPIILYNVPGRTSSNVLPETTIKIATACKNVVAVKEASGSVDQIMKIIKDKPDNFLVISGDDTITLPLMAAGADGVISVVGNAFPESFRKVVHGGDGSDLETARREHYRLFDITNLLFAEGNPGGIKEALQFLGICENHMRLPLYNVSPATAEKLKEAMIKSGFLQ
jgi:4-hydroxy-tetrahydrodipicolinate synthase